MATRKIGFLLKGTRLHEIWRAEGKPIALLSLANYCNAAALLGCNMIIGRQLGPVEFGFFAVFLSVAPVIFELTGYGLDAAMVRFAAPFVPARPDKAAEVFRLVLAWKIAMNAALFALIAPLLKPLLALASDSPRYPGIILCAVLMGFAFSVWRFTLTVFQTVQAYGRYALTLVLNGLIRLAAILTAVFVFSLDLPLTMLICIGTTVLAAALGLVLMPGSYRSVKLAWRNSGSLLKEITRFSLWLIMSTLVFIAVEPVSIFLIGYFRDSRTVGLFAAALILAKSIDYVNLSVKTVLMPHACALDSRSLWPYTKKCLNITLPIAVLLLPIPLAAKFLVEIFFSSIYLEAVPLFKVLFWAYWLSLILDPLWLIFYATRKTHYFLWADLLMLATVLVGAVLMIPGMGAEGAAYSFLAGRIAGRLLLGILIVFDGRSGSAGVKISEAVV